jgi:hypothetical protein
LIILKDFEIKFVLNNGRNKFSFSCPCGLRYFSTEESKEATVDSGVPQGTVLEPFLFLYHTNDLPDAVKSSVRLFADVGRIIGFY